MSAQDRSGLDPSTSGELGAPRDGEYVSQESGHKPLPEVRLPRCHKHFFTRHRWWCKGCRKHLHNEFAEVCEALWTLQRKWEDVEPVQVRLCGWVPGGRDPGWCSRGMNHRGPHFLHPTREQAVEWAGLTGDCSVDCLNGCAYPGEFSECGNG